MVVDLAVLQKTVEIETGKPEQLPGLKMREIARAVASDGQSLKGFAAGIGVLAGR